MKQVPDSNDIVYNTPGIDIASLIRALYERLLGSDYDAFLTTLSYWWNIYAVIAIILSLLFLLGLVYTIIRYAQLSEIQQEQLREAEATWGRLHRGIWKGNARWEDIQTHVAGEKPNDWRLAIIEADILLEEALTNAGYVGATIGEKLKTANQTSFQTLQDAWEAHKVRNQIAHAGSDFVLTNKLAQETITRYERVFREFGSI